MTFYQDFLITPSVTQELDSSDVSHMFCAPAGIINKISIIKRCR